MRGADERGKSNEQRLREYADSNLPKIASSLLATTPLYPDFEQVTLSFSLDKMREALGPDDADRSQTAERANRLNRWRRN